MIYLYVYYSFSGYGEEVVLVLLWAKLMGVKITIYAMELM
jgi:hypothetical protein